MSVLPNAATHRTSACYQEPKSPQGPRLPGERALHRVVFLQP